MRSRPSKRYMNAIAALYGTSAQDGQLDMEMESKASHGQKKRLKPNVPLEVQEQIAAATWMTNQQIIFYHIPNGGYRDYREAAKFKRMGVKPGVPDICIPIARQGFHGLYIELKRVTGGSVSETQRFWLEELRKQGYDVFIAKGAKELINYVKNYLGA